MLYVLQAGHPTELKERTELYRCNNVEFVDWSRDNTAIADYKNHSIVCIRAIENITKSMELYVSYGKACGSLDQ